MNPEMIKITGLKKDFGDLQVLRGIDLSIAEKEVVVIIGPSGSGKSTLLRCINYLEEPTAGEIVFDTIPLNGEANINEVRKEIGMVFQRFNLFPHMTVMENLILAPMKVRHTSKKEAEALALFYLKKVGLEEKADSYPDQLSGGQQQRVAIARAIVNHPKILLADEPTGALDSASGEQVMDLFQKLNDEGITIIMITHDADIASHARRQAIIRDGILTEKEAEKDETEETSDCRD